MNFPPPPPVPCYLPPVKNEVQFDASVMTIPTPPPPPPITRGFVDTPRIPPAVPPRKPTTLLSELKSKLTYKKKIKAEHLSEQIEVTSDSWISEEDLSIGARLKSRKRSSKK